MNAPPEIRLFAATATGIAVFALVLSHLRKPAEQVIKKGLIADPDRVGKLAKSESERTGLGQSDDEFDYDFIIIGGGTAGSAIASRLSERLDFRVLLLEAGTSGVVLRMSRVPFAYGGLMGSNHDWSLFTASQTGCDNRRIFWSRTKLLGGCSSGNALLFHYGASTDYDEWASATDEPECKEWGFARFYDSFRKFETFHPHPDFPVDESTRGSHGPVQTGFYGYFSNLAQAFVAACKSVGVPFNPDLNTARGTIGVSKVMTFMTSPPTRCSAEAAYLTPAVLARANLTVATHAHVTRILFEGKRAVGVEFARTQGSPRYQARAHKEVILCAGTVHTPHILMHSGVGPAQELEKYDIPVVHDSPGVGDHLMDHVLVPTRYRTTPGESLCYLNPDTGKGFWNAMRRTRAAWQYFLTKTGPLTTNVAEAVCFFRSDDPKLFPSLSPLDEDSTSGPNAPDIELVLMPLGFGVESAPEGHLMTIAALLLSYLDTQHDVDVLVRGLRVALRLSQEEPLRSMIVQTDTAPDLDLSLLNADDATLVKQVRARAETGYHPTSTARIGSVVDTRLRVYGLEGLRVADCSVIPTIISGHTEAAALAIGEKAADMIKAAHPTA